MLGLSILAALGAPDAMIPLARFDGSAGLTHRWTEMNDPVMGGQSVGSCGIVASNATLVFTGEVKIVPSLKAPGFIHCSSSPTGLRRSFPDVTGCAGIAVTLRARSAYDGFRLSFGDAHPAGGKFFAYGYKANLGPVAISAGFTVVRAPFDAFTDLWDDATGEPIKSCAEHPQYCPDGAALRDLKTISLWAEGKLGTVNLEVRAIDAYGCRARGADAQAIA